MDVVNLFFREAQDFAGIQTRSREETCDLRQRRVPYRKTLLRRSKKDSPPPLP
jgi:hypothetical protein